MPQRVLSRQFLIASSAAIALALPIASAFAQVPVAAGTSDIETSKYTYLGEVKADGTLVRSGPSENDYQVLKLNKGTKLTIVGMRFDWLKIVPPEGAFCLVSQAFIDKGGDGTTGRVINKGASVRIGSSLTQAMHRVLPRQLDPGETVKIIGEAGSNEFYKIVPPKDVFMYVDKKFVIPVQRTDAGAPAAIAGAGAAGAAGASGATESANAGSAGATAPLAEGSGSTTVQPQPGTQAPVPAGAEDPRKFVVRSELPQEGAGAVASAEANATAIRAIQEKLSTLEDRYAAAGKDESGASLDELSKDYATLLENKQIPPNARKVAEYRASQIKLRKAALEEMATARKTQEEAARKQRDLKAEQEELAAHVAATQVKHYAAVGRLLPSSLQVSGQPLYRLVDPATSRLIIYVRAGKVPVADGIDKFIAINGQVVQDDQMRMTYVQPESFEVADPKHLNTKIFADYAPPSMATANVAGEASAR